VFLLGCPASVTAEAVDGGFGFGWSATWVVYQYGKAESEGIMLSNVLGYCDKQTKAYDAMSAFYERSQELEGKSKCSEIETETRDYFGAWEAMYFEGANYASGAPVGDMETGEFELGRKASFSVVALTNSPYAGILDAFDPDETISAGCGVEDEGDDPDSDEWVVKDGDLVIDALADETSLSGSVEGEMVQQGDEQGAFAASFTASYCEIEIPDFFGE
jgi:hypothetical protein